MKRVIRTLGSLAVLTLAVAACGGTEVTSNTNTGGTATLTGGLSGSIQVHAAAAYTPGLPNPMFYSFVTSSAGGPNVGFNVGLPGTDLVDGTYTFSNLTMVDGHASLLTDPTKTWSTTYGGSATTQGTLTIVIKGYGTAHNNPGGTKSWLFVHGSLNATMPADVGTGATGTTTVSATF